MHNTNKNTNCGSISENPKTKPSEISRNFLPPKIKRLLLGLVSYDVFPKELVRWRGRFHNHVQNKSTKNKKSLLGLVSYVYFREIHFSGVDANIMFLNKCCALRRAYTRTCLPMIIIPDRPSLLKTSCFVQWVIFLFSPLRSGSSCTICWTFLSKLSKGTTSQPIYYYCFFPFRDPPWQQQ